MSKERGFPIFFSNCIFPSISSKNILRVATILSLIYKEFLEFNASIQYLKNWFHIFCFSFWSEEVCLRWISTTNFYDNFETFSSGQQDNTFQKNLVPVRCSNLFTFIRSLLFISRRSILWLTFKNMVYIHIYFSMVRVW